MIEKRCSKCGDVKGLDLFVKKGGVCKECRSKYQREYRENNYEKIKKQERKHCDQLSNRYVRKQIVKQYSIKSSECTPELIESKRKEILIKREIKEVKKRLKEIKSE